MANDLDIDIGDVHRAVGAIVAAATSLEAGLTEAVVSLSRSPLTSLVVQGERGSALSAMAKRLLQGGIGSSVEDEESGRAGRLGLISAADTAAFIDALSRADMLLRERDAVVHSQWLANVETGRLQAFRKTRAKQHVRTWTLDQLDRLRQDLANCQMDIFILSWNTSGSGMTPLSPRQGDVQ